MDKQTIRETVWDALEEQGIARFPFPPHDRIPNFEGASEAAQRLTETAVWDAAETVKANPDSPQLPVRRAALRAGKTVYMAVPRLRDERCFYELDPDELDDIEAAPAISNVADHARQVGPEAVGSVDLVVSGSVAVTEDGARIGKGEGYSDLEYAVLRELGLVDKTTPVVTTVHELQIVGGPEGVVDTTVPVDDHDVPMDWVVTPERTVETETTHTTPAGVDWDALSTDRIDEIPVLSNRRPD
ncbi:MULTISPECIES: 5-formyltetrahydrofolate cyclo-ligase [unclassified Haloarcula]|uniref:5-formyltetrahydrofolate cyclo-ligase n=1 Tax=unclassified Haloarcula TaxID=2624677 RepID=UPI0012480B29|nr:MULTISPECIES: 5-formyltetrahydrofolate cyclo-ligase [unclassified Haloarcula]KAA9407986.1 5-formyltetrahydrofolate cyclo-ligase [Haloarcula sp. CBA1131]MUV51110.1 5-formyltetrahydrofolate cyclo-ligase [Haloarcula sp. CBA1122]